MSWPLISLSLPLPSFPLLFNFSLSCFVYPSPFPTHIPPFLSCLFLCLTSFFSPFSPSLSPPFLPLSLPSFLPLPSLPPSLSSFLPPPLPSSLSPRLPACLSSFLPPYLLSSFPPYLLSSFSPYLPPLHLLPFTLFPSSYRQKLILESPI